MLALKRGSACGILNESDGRYSLPTGTEKECMELANQELGLLDLNCKKRREQRRKRKLQREGNVSNEKTGSKRASNGKSKRSSHGKSPSANKGGKKRGRSQSSSSKRPSKKKS